LNILKGREYAPKGEAWDKAVEYWKTLKSDSDGQYSIRKLLSKLKVLNQ